MVVAICILSFLLLCAILIIAILWRAINRLLNEYVDNHPQEFVKFYLDKYAEEKFPCTLLLTENNNADFNGSIYDFSLYEENNIIGLTECKQKTTINIEDDEDDEPCAILIPNQTVFKMKDGSYQWDFRGFI